MADLAAKLKILERFDGEDLAAERVASGHGEVHLVRRITGYKKIRYYTHENIGYGPITLPDREMHTSALWWKLSDATLASAFPSRWAALDGFLGAAYALHTVACLAAMSESRDLGKAVGSGQGEWSGVLDVNGRGQLRDADANPLDVGALARFEPTVFLYDNYPGGTGLAQPLHAQRALIVRDAAALVRGCACKHGCPACVGPVLQGDEDDARAPKQAALAVLGLVADQCETRAF